MSSLVSSSLIRSADTISRRSCICSIARTTRGAGASSSWAANLAARSIRSGSSENAISGSSGVSSRLAARSFTPPNGSTNSPSGSRIAIALTVKSRRDRSVSQVLAERHGRLAVLLRVDLLAEGRDLQDLVALAGADRPELHADQVQPLGPAAQDLRRLLRGRRRSRSPDRSRAPARAAAPAPRHPPGRARDRPGGNARRARWRSGGSRGARRRSDATGRP